MRRLAATLAVAFGVLLVPAAASAVNFEVTTLEDFNLGVEACTEGVECSLRDAIDRANETAEADEITFAELFHGKIEPEGSLPQVAWPVTIDATTAADYSDAGHPVIELSGEAISDPESRGIELMENAGGSRVEGLAIGGFRIGIFSYSETPNYICANYIGILPDGETASPNEYAGVANAAISKGLRIGAECAAGGNVISGNEEFGILEAGEGTVIKGNRIGVGPEGEPLPNGDSLLVSAGIEVHESAKAPVIGGLDQGNLILYNEGQGVRVRNAASAATIRGNSIHSNLLGEIQIDAGAKTAVPLLESASVSGEGKSTATGKIKGGQPNQQYLVDIYANESCEGGEGEAEVFLGSVATETDAAGLGAFSTESLGEALPGRDFFTATATLAATGSTSTISACGDLQPEPPLPPVQPPGQPPVQALVQLQPENGESVAVAPVSGVVFIKLPGKAKPVKLTEGMLIPVGAVVDATKGKVTLTSVNKAGETQTAVFYGGKFLIAEQERNGLVVLKLRGVLRCGKARPSLATASAGRKGRRLWGSGKGKFRTEGNYGSATVRGTVWLTEDRCGGTFFKVSKGVVSVRDFPAGQTISLPAGKSYLAKSP